MNHTLPLPLPWGKNSKAYFSLAPADRLIVFIHGFGGGAIKTWKGMDELLENPAAASSDIVFYGYPSLNASAQNSATLFRKLVLDADTVSQPWRHAVWRAGASPVDRTYGEILIIAHSLGAVVTRRALLDGIRRKEAWAPKTRLLLFGPAHLGTRLIELVNMFRSQPLTFFSDLFLLARAKIPVLADLKEDSKFLKKLGRETRAAIAGGETVHIAREVWFGENDNVVVTDRFCDDPDGEVEPGEGHCSICRMPSAVHIVSGHL